MSDERPGPTTEVRLLTVDDGRGRTIFDCLATEEPLHIRLRAGGTTRDVAVTMRTPGHDFELAAGFLSGEGVVRKRADIRHISYCRDPGSGAEQRYNVVTVDLAARELPALDALERHFATTAACGVCGKTSLVALRERGVTPVSSSIRLDAASVLALPQRLREKQHVFASTGGLHAAGLFDGQGQLLAVREDVGRHNALDKLLGWAFLDGRFPLANCAVAVSGRSSYELVQKTVCAGAGALVSVSAPSSLAVALAREFGLTLIGFTRGTRFNVYAGAERVALDGTASVAQARAHR